MLTYLIWAVPYAIFLFKFRAQRIKERNYDCLYVYCSKLPAVQPLIKTFGGVKNIPMIFMGSHFVYYFVSVCIAFLCFHSYLLHTAWMAFFLLISVWNGASFYMDYFAKKYQFSLEKLEQLQKEMDEAGDSSKDE